MTYKLWYLSISMKEIYKCNHIVSIALFFEVKMKILLPFLILLSVTGCLSTTLTEQGKKVQLLMKEEAPKEYQLIDDIATTGLGESDIIGVKNNLRNKTAALGGDLVVIDTIEMHSGDAGTYYTGNGRAYKLKKK